MRSGAEALFGWSWGGCCQRGAGLGRRWALCRREIPAFAGMTGWGGGLGLPGQLCAPVCSIGAGSAGRERGWAGGGCVEHAGAGDGNRTRLASLEG